jgi:secretion/DNA translocation related TadE-like protein
MNGGYRTASGSPLSGRADRRTDQRHSAPDQGYATVWVAGGIAALTVVFAVALHLGAAVLARHRAAAAADLAALAAATNAVSGERMACERAQWVVERMEAHMLSCGLSGWDALVEVQARATGLGVATAHARAGPVSG